MKHVILIPIFDNYLPIENIEKDNFINSEEIGID